MYLSLAFIITPLLFVLLLFLLRKQDVVFNFYVSAMGALFLGFGVLGFVLGMIFGFDNTEKHGIVFGNPSHPKYQEQPLTPTEK